MHRIESKDKQQGTEMAWHGLTEIKPDLSLDNNFLTEWDIQKTPLFTKHEVAPDANVASVLENEVQTKFSILTATDDPSIVIGVPFNPESYRPITNAEFVKLVKDATEGTTAKLVSAGSVRNRGRVFLTLQQEQLETYQAGGRTFKPYLNFGNGHDKSSVLWANTSNIATVCDNTFSMNLSSVESKIVDSVRQRHTKNVVARLPDISMIIRNAVALQKDFAMAFENLASNEISEERAERIFTGFVAFDSKDTISTRAKNIIANLMDLFKNGKGNHGQNLADLFSAVTDYYTHSNAGNGRAPWKQFHSSEFGDGATKKQDFFRLVNNPEEVAKAEKLGTDLMALK